MRTPFFSSPMEPRFGTDFSQVRVHTGEQAVQMNQELGAQAFTHGSNIYYGPGKVPGVNELTAHELTHVVQQTDGVQLKNAHPEADNSSLVENQAETSEETSITTPTLSQEIVSEDSGISQKSSTQNLSKYNSHEVFIYDGKLFRIQHIDGSRYWISREIGSSSSDKKVKGPQELQEWLSRDIGVLPDGGALIYLEDSLFWMSHQGEVTRRLTIAGIIRHGNDVFAAFPDDQQMTVVHFVNGDIAQTQIIKNLPPDARLVRTDGSGYDFFASNSNTDPGRLIYWDSKTQQLSETPLSDSPSRLLSIEGRVVVGYPVIIDANTLLLAGADPDGAFVVRVGFQKLSSSNSRSS